MTQAAACQQAPTTPTAPRRRSPMKSPLIRWTGMFDDHAAGIYDLPDVVLTAKAAADRLDAALVALERPDVEEARATAVAALRVAAKTNEPLPETTVVRETA